MSGYLSKFLLGFMIVLISGLIIWSSVQVFQDLQITFQYDELGGEAVLQAQEIRKLQDFMQIEEKNLESQDERAHFIEIREKLDFAIKYLLDSLDCLETRDYESAREILRGSKQFIQQIKNELEPYRKYV